MSNGYEKFFKDAKKVKHNEPSRKSNATADDAIRAALKMRKVKKRDLIETIPWKLGLSLAAALIIAAAGYIYVDEIVNFVNRIDVHALASASAEEKPAATKAVNAAANAAPANAQTKPGNLKIEDLNEEELSHLKKLSERKSELDLREAELNALEEELHKQKQEIEARLQKLEQVRNEIATVLKDRVEMDEERIKTLVEFYSNMKPKQAAEVFANLNEDLAVEILGRMKKKNAADIMNLLQPAKAKILSEKFTGYKRR